MRVDELIHTLQQERSWIDSMIAQLTYEQMEIPGVEADWSVKDIIAHLAAWEQRGTQWIEWARAVAQGDQSQVTQAGYSAKDVDHLNRETWLQNKDSSVESVLDNFRQSFLPLLTQIQMLRDCDLETIIQADWTDHKSVTVGEIVTWRYWHYRSHGKLIAHWIEKLKQSSGDLQ